jgi:protein phosphatase
MKLSCFETAELSDVGRKRKNNEDACLRIPEKGVYCVADGMGGVVGGDLASEAIITRLQKVFARTSAEESESFAGHVALFRRAANAASKWIREFAEDKVIGQMGSTLVALVFDPNNPRRAVGLHAGDSRLYRYRNGQLQLLTADHSAAAALAAKLGRDPAKMPDKYQNELTRAVGLAETVELEKTPVDVASGDLFLLCSDGLTRMVSEAAISKVLKRNNDTALGEVAQTLISGANEAGGKDNITVILVRMGDLSGFPEVIEADDLDEPQTKTAPAGSEGDTFIPTEPEMRRTPDPSESMRGHTPQTDDTPTMQGDTPSDGPPAQMRGDTPRTADPSGPSTPSAAAPKTSPEGADEKKDKRAMEGKHTSRKGIIIGTALAVIAIAGVYFHYGSGPRSPQSNPPLTPPKPPPLTGGVVIQSEPGGAEVFHLGRRVGVTPYETNGVPAGEVSYTLGTMTRTGMVMLLVKAGEKQSTNLTLKARLGTLAIHSDPPGAEVWLGSQDKGKTPISLELAAGQTQVRLKVAGLEDQTATLMVVASKTNETNVTFAYGSVVIRSEPDGTAVRQNGEVVGYTPYTNNRVAPGQSSWQLASHGWQTTNVPVEVFDHRTSVAAVRLQKEKGVLRLTANLPGVTAGLDGAGVGRLPASVPVEAGMLHTVTAEYKGRRQTNPPVRVESGKTKAVEFTFDEQPQPLSRWTNDLMGLGMVFVKLPGANVWVATNRVTLEQFTKVMNGAPGAAKEREENGQRYVINLTSAIATNFAAKLTGAAKGGGGLPEGIKNYHFALPTPDQWEETFANADKLGIQMTNLVLDKEWCLDGDSWYMAGYVQGGNFYPEPGHKLIKAPPDQPKPFALRLVLVP